MTQWKNKLALHFIIYLALHVQMQGDLKFNNKYAATAFELIFLEINVWNWGNYLLRFLGTVLNIIDRWRCPTPLKITFIRWIKVHSPFSFYAVYLSKRGEYDLRFIIAIVFWAVLQSRLSGIFETRQRKHSKTNPDFAHCSLTTVTSIAVAVYLLKINGFKKTFSMF